MTAPQGQGLREEIEAVLGRHLAGSSRDAALRAVLAVLERRGDDTGRVERVRAVADFVHECSEGIAPTWARVYLDIEQRLREALDGGRDGQDTEDGGDGGRG